MSKILLHLGFDYFSKGRTGVGTYAGNIIWGLDAQYDIIVPSDSSAPLPDNANTIILSPLKKRIMGILKKFLPITCFFRGYDIAITGGFCFKHSRKTKQIIIVHDLMSFTEPQNYTLKQRFYHKIAASSYKNADKIIAVSQSTKQALHDLFRIDFNKIVVLPNITDFYIEHSESTVFLFIGDMRKTKNLASLIAGFAEYVKKYGGSEKLIIAGSKKYEYAHLVQLTKDLNIEKQVEFSGYISDEQKRTYFSKTKAFVFLSDNEGFGIPLLEAGVNGIPVLCSDIPVFHEVLNEDFAVYVDNKEPEKIAQGFLAIREKCISTIKADELKKRYSFALYKQKLNDFITQL